MTHSFLVTGPIASNFFVAMAGASGVFLVSGGNSLYKIAGVVKRQMMAGTLAILAQVSQGLDIWTPSSSASLRHNKF